VGLIVYFWHSTPEQQGTNDIRKPSYVTQRGEVVPEASESEKRDDVV